MGIDSGIGLRADPRYASYILRNAGISASTYHQPRLYTPMLVLRSLTV